MAEGRTRLSEPESAALLAAYGIPGPREALATTEEAAAEAAGRLGYPVVLKLCSPDVLHKSEVGGVRLGLADDGAVRAAFDELHAAVAARGGRFHGALVQEEVRADLEVIVGACFDATFGPVVLVGFGGIEAELLGDRAVRVAPVGPVAARRMLAELRGARLLERYRGQPAVDLDALAELIVATSRLACEVPIEELDLNPVLVRRGASGAVPVDRRVILRRPDPGVPPAGVPAEATPDPRAAIRSLLAPAAVVVVGASRDPAKIGSRVLRFLTRHGFPGRVFVVHPRGEALLDGVPTVRSVEALPGDVEVACIAVPPEACEPTLRACGARGSARPSCSPPGSQRRGRRRPSGGWSRRRVPPASACAVPTRSAS